MFSLGRRGLGNRTQQQSRHPDSPPLRRSTRSASRSHRRIRRRTTRPPRRLTAAWQHDRRQGESQLRCRVHGTGKDGNAALPDGADLREGEELLDRGATGQRRGAGGPRSVRGRHEHTCGSGEDDRRNLLSNSAIGSARFAPSTTTGAAQPPRHARVGRGPACARGACATPRRPDAR